MLNVTKGYMLNIPFMYCFLAPEKQLEKTFLPCVSFKINYDLCKEI